MAIDPSIPLSGRPVQFNIDPERAARTAMTLRSLMNANAMRDAYVWGPNNVLDRNATIANLAKIDPRLAIQQQHELNLQDKWNSSADLRQQELKQRIEVQRQKLLMRGIGAMRGAASESLGMFLLQGDDAGARQSFQQRMMPFWQAAQFTPEQMQAAIQNWSPEGAQAMATGGMDANLREVAQRVLQNNERLLWDSGEDFDPAADRGRVSDTPAMPPVGVYGADQADGEQPPEDMGGEFVQTAGANAGRPGAPVAGEAPAKQWFRRPDGTEVPGITQNWMQHAPTTPQEQAAWAALVSAAQSQKGGVRNGGEILVVNGQQIPNWPLLAFKRQQRLQDYQDRAKYKIGTGTEITIGDMQKGTRKELEKDLVEAGASLALIGQIKSGYREQFLKVPTQLSNWGAKWAEKLDVANMSPSKKRELAQYYNWRSNTYDLLNSYIKRLSGAQVTDQEKLRLYNQLPDPEDGVTEFESSINALEQSLRMIQARSVIALERGLVAGVDEQGRPTLSEKEVRGAIGDLGTKIKKELRAKFPSMNNADLDKEVDAELALRLGFAGTTTTRKKR